MTDHGGAASPRTATWMDGHINELLRLSAVPDNRDFWNIRVDARTSLAILDRLREAEAAQEAPAPEGLRAALASLLAAIDREELSFEDASLRQTALVIRKARAALAATPPTPAEPPPCPDCGPYAPCPKHDDDLPWAEARPPEGLDAERLARAITVAARLPQHRGILPRLEYGTAPDGFVQAIAAEYARLSAGGATKP